MPAALRAWRTEALENAIVERGGCAAEQRSIEAWNSHPQGKAVNAEPLVAWSARGRVESFAVDPPAPLLIETLQDDWPAPLAAATASDFSESTEVTDWGPAQRLRFPARFAKVKPGWKIPAHELHSHSANWESS